MKCPMCNNEMPNKSLIGHWIVHTDKGEGIEVCGRCFLLASIIDHLKELKDGNN